MEDAVATVGAPRFGLGHHPPARSADNSRSELRGTLGETYERGGARGPDTPRASCKVQRAAISQRDCMATRDGATSGVAVRIKGELTCFVRSAETSGVESG